MGVFEMFRRRIPPVDGGRLIGSWTSRGAEMVVRPDGTMDYILVLPRKRQIMNLTYRLDGNCIISNQPSSPREDRTRFWFEGDELVLEYEGERTRYQRATTS